MPDEQPIPAEPVLATPEPAQASPSSEASESLPHEEPTPMLDVHPARHAPGTWREFFIHIATITVGLLIAIGLEQSVEALIHRHEERELIRQMRAEAERNVPILDIDIRSASTAALWFRVVIDSLQQAVSRDGSIAVTLPPLKTIGDAREPSRAVWSVAKANGKVALLPENLAEVYDRLDYDAEDCRRAEREDSATEDEVAGAEARLQIRVEPGATVHLSVADRPDLVRIQSERYAALRNITVASAKWAASADAVAHDVQSRAEINPYLSRHIAELSDK